jgi:hypothetical protein
MKDAVQPFIDALNKVKEVWDNTIGKIHEAWQWVRGLFGNVKSAAEGMFNGGSIPGRSFNTYATSPLLFKGYPSLPEISAGKVLINIHVTANNADRKSSVRN